MTEYDLGKVVGDDGETGNGIASITKTGTSGLVDTYTITFDDGTTTTFTVTNGSDASVTIQTAWGSTTSDSKVPSEKLTKDSLDNKVSKSSTTGLLKNDGTVMTSGTGSSNYSAGNHTHSGYISTSSTTGLVKNDGSIDTTTYLSSLPSHTHDDDDIDVEGVDFTNIASLLGISTSEFTSQDKANHYIDQAFGSIDTALAGKIGTSSTVGLIKNDGSVMTGGTGSSNYAIGNHTHSGYVSATKVTSWQSTPSDSNVPSEKLVKDYVDGLIGSAITYIVGSGN